MGGDKQTPDFQAVEAGDRGHPGEGKISGRVALWWGVNIDRGGLNVGRSTGLSGRGTRVTNARGVCSTMRYVCCFRVLDRSWGLLYAQRATVRRDSWYMRQVCLKNHQAHKRAGVRSLLRDSNLKGKASLSHKQTHTSVVPPGFQES